MRVTTIPEAGELPAAPAQPGHVPGGAHGWAKAFSDVREGLNRRELWGHLGWQDIKQRYRRSALGPLWITMSMAITATGLGLLYSQLFGMQISTFLPYIATGFVVWNFLLGCLTEGTDTFISNEGIIKQLPAPLTVHVLRTLWRQTLVFAHNLIVYAVLLAIFWSALTTDGYHVKKGGIPQPGFDLSALLAIPGFLLLAINAGWVILLFGIASTRFRDIPQVITSLTSLLFFMTPIVWSTDVLAARVSSANELIYQLNPLYHFVQVVRAPLIGNHLSIWSWIVVISFGVAGWAAALFVMRKYRSRVAYWV